MSSFSVHVNIKNNGVITHEHIRFRRDFKEIRRKRTNVHEVFNMSDKQTKKTYLMIYTIMSAIQSHAVQN